MAVRRASDLFCCRACGTVFDPALALAAYGPACPLCHRPLSGPQPGRRRGSGRHARRRLFVAERDGWLCHLCGLAVESNATGKGMPSLDHVVPLSMGGRTIYSNLKLAHAGCNSKRGSQPLQPQEA